MKNLPHLLLLLSLQLCLHNEAHAQKPKNAAKWPVPVPHRTIKDTNYVQREIDIYERKNAPLLYVDDSSFAFILLNGIKSGAIKAYSNDDTTFTTPLTLTAIDTLIHCDATKLSVPARTYLNNVSKYSGDTTIIDTSFITSCSYPQQVEFYLLKQTWLFNRKEGYIVSHIDALAPVVNVNGEKKPLFWLHYPDIKDYLRQFKVEKLQNDKDNSTWARYFDCELFSDRIHSSSFSLFEESSEKIQTVESKKSKKRSSRNK